jgi:hypothetical protein
MLSRSLVDHQNHETVERSELCDLVEVRKELSG